MLQKMLWVSELWPTPHDSEFDSDTMNKLQLK